MELFSLMFSHNSALINDCAADGSNVTLLVPN